MITAAVEELHRCLEELKPLFDPHWKELALDQDKVPLCPDYAEYLRREAAGQVLCVTLRERGGIVGYFVGFIAPALHYQTCLTLTMDIYWIHPDYRASDSLSRLEEVSECHEKRDQREHQRAATGAEPTGGALPALP